MSRDKKMFNDLVEIFEDEYGRRNLTTPQNTAEKLTAKGYRKSTEVAEEIFAEIETSLMIESFHGGEVYYAIRAEDYLHYKKKYTENKGE